MRADADHAPRDKVEKIMDQVGALWMVVKRVDLLFQVSAFVYRTWFASESAPYSHNRGFPICSKLSLLV